MKLLKFFGSGFSKETPRYRFFIIFSILWFLIAGASFALFIANDKTFIWNIDGWEQHYKALAYYGNYLREIGKNIVKDHQLVIPQYDFNISEGADILHVLNYYVMGDPLALSSAFVPEKYTHILYSVLNVLRMYFAGISFCVMSFGLGKRNRYSIFAGAITYSFCMWALLNAARHPYFLNPMIYMPLIILGIEKALRKERPYLLVIIMSVTAISNFYFFQMIIIMSAIYTLVKCICLNGKNIKSIILNVLKVAGMIAIGIGIAGFILLPIMGAFMNDNRGAMQHVFNLFYPSSYYYSLPGIVLSTGSCRWLLIGMTPAAFLSCILLFKGRKKNTFIKILFIICCLIMIFPIGGRIFNGLTYETNRWCWVFLLLCSYILVIKWENLISLKTSEKIILFIGGTGFFLIGLLFDKSNNNSLFTALIVLFIVLFVICEGNVFSKTVKQVLVCVCTIGSVVLTAFWYYSPNGDDIVSNMMDNKKISMNDYKDVTKVLNENVSNNIRRYSGRDISINSGMVQGVSSTDYYWTLSNPNVAKFRGEMELNNTLSYYYEGYDDRTAMLSLSAVDYYVEPEKEFGGIPYGFEKKVSTVINENTNYVVNIYENSLSLPLAYCYDSYINENQWNDMDALDKQQAQLTGVYLREKNSTDNLNNYIEKKSYHEIPFTVITGDEVTYNEGCFITTKDNATAKIIFQGKVNSETYLELKGLKVTPVKSHDLYFGNNDVDPEELYSSIDWDYLSANEQWKIKKEKKYWDPAENSSFEIKINTVDNEKKFYYLTEYAQFYEGTNDFMINMGYNENPLEYMEITFPSKGIYSLTDLKVHTVTFEDFKDDIQVLKEKVPDKIEYGTDKLNIDIALDKDVLMCVAIPYHEGWKVNVDGITEKIYQANDRYMGIKLSKGDHNVELVYIRPLQKEGFILTIVGVAIFAIIIIAGEIKYKRKKTFDWQKRKN